jgi:hypothetical protein
MDPGGVGLKFGIDLAGDVRAVQQIGQAAETGHSALSHA